MGRTSMTQPVKLPAVDQDEDVERVAVVAEGAGDEAVVAGVVDGRVEVAVEPEDVQVLVVLVLVDAFERGFRRLTLITSGHFGPTGSSR